MTNALKDWEKDNAGLDTMNLERYRSKLVAHDSLYSREKKVHCIWAQDVKRNLFRYGDDNVRPLGLHGVQSHSPS